MTSPANKRSLLASLIVVALLAPWPTAAAGPLRDRLIERRLQRASPQQALETASDPGSAAVLPAGIRIMRDISYGSDPRQRFDVYAPAQASATPVLLLVHGGAWRFGDKAARTVVENKVAHWLPQGFIVVSTNYRMLPDIKPVEQARDVALALAAAQAQAASWGGDRKRFI